jgi:uncharacterized protein (DUF2342 family)
MIPQPRASVTSNHWIDMSLYMFGKIVGPDRAQLESLLASVAGFSAVELVLDRLDAEDRQAVEASGHLRGPGVFFTFNTSLGAAEATQLWIDAMNRIRQHVEPMDCAPERLPSGLFAAFTATTLGRIGSSVLGAGTAAGIALVDGGIEQSFVGSRSACLRQMICDVARTWDQSPNRLYVCRNTAAEVEEQGEVA